MYKKINFERSVFHIKDIPEISLPSVILCGRSNVGKSSFINSLFNRKNLARISSYPGKTRSINYYNVDDNFYVIDLPGYGYAKTSKVERESWARLITEFIMNAKNISLAVHLIDSRHKPTDLDVKLNDLLRFTNLPYITLLSKVDKLNQSEKALALKTISKYFPELIRGENLFFFSSVKGIGKKEILSRFTKLFFLN